MKATGKFALLAAATTALTFGWAAPAASQATRTWVGSGGADANPCSRTAPCQTFAGAIAKTAAGGEINCIDAGGYGAVSVIKSITIDCTGTHGSILNGGTQGVIINDSTGVSPGTSEVILRGLSLNGTGPSAGVNGIRLLSGRSLVVENVMIQNQGGPSAAGISITPSVSAEVYLNNVTITDGTGGILIQPTGAAGALRGSLRDVRIYNNSGTGLRIDTTGNTAPFGIILAIREGTFAGNAGGISVNTPAGTTAAIVTLDHSEVSGNSGTGIATSGTASTIRVGNTIITGNTTGVSVGAGTTINTSGNNRNRGNGADGAFTLPVLAGD